MEAEETGWSDFRTDARAGLLLGLAAIPVTLALGPAEMTPVVMMAGAFQILFARAGVACFASYIPYSVLAGIFAGFAVILVEAQLRMLLDAEGEGAPMGGRSRCQTVT